MSLLVTLRVSKNCLPRILEEIKGKRQWQYGFMAKNRIL